MFFPLLLLLNLYMLEIPRLHSSVKSDFELKNINKQYRTNLYAFINKLRK